MATIERVKPIVLTIGDKTYTLEFNRNSVMSAERAGLDLARIVSEPMNTIPLLFYTIKLIKISITSHVGPFCMCENI